MLETSFGFWSGRDEHKCCLIQEAEIANLLCHTDPSTALEEAMASGEVDEMPSGFKRLQSPRFTHRQPNPIQSTLQAQLDCLPMTYAAQFEGHLRDLRILLGAEVWQRVQTGLC